MVILPLIFFFLEGIVFFNLISLSSSPWIRLMTTPMPTYEESSWLGIFAIPGWIFRTIYWVLCEIAGVVGFLFSLLTIPISLMIYYPVLIPIHVIMIVIMVFGIIMKIRVAGSGVEGE